MSRKVEESLWPVDMELVDEKKENKCYFPNFVFMRREKTSQTTRLKQVKTE